MERKKLVIFIIVIVLVAGATLTVVDYGLRNDATKASVIGLTFERTPGRLERGRYIVEGPAHCFQCHSEVDWQNPGAQPKKGKKAAGTVFIEDGMDWLVAPNITPDRETGAGTWTDDQFARAIREGIGHDG